MIVTFLVNSKNTIFCVIFYTDSGLSDILRAINPFFLNLSGCGTSENNVTYSAPDRMANTAIILLSSFINLSNTNLINIKHIYYLLSSVSKDFLNLSY